MRFYQGAFLIQINFSFFCFPAQLDGFSHCVAARPSSLDKLVWYPVLCMHRAVPSDMACSSQCVSKCIVLPQLILPLYITMLACRLHLRETIPCYRHSYNDYRLLPQRAMSLTCMFRDSATVSRHFC